MQVEQSGCTSQSVSALYEKYKVTNQSRPDLQKDETQSPILIQKKYRALTRSSKSNPIKTGMTKTWKVKVY